MKAMRKKWTISDEARKEVEKGLEILLKDHVDFLSGKKDKKDYPSFQPTTKRRD